MKWNFVALGCLLWLINVPAYAGVVIGGTRVIYPAEQAEVQISLKNKDTNARYLVQSWVSNVVDDSKAPFIITPPIYKLEEDRRTLLHVVYTGDSHRLPQDRESLFIVNVKSVPAIPSEMRNKNTLQLALKTKIKLFWRPTGLKNDAAKTAWEKLQFHRQGERVVVKNPTPFYITFGQFKYGGQEIPAPRAKEVPSALSMMIAPFSEQAFSLPASGHGAITWTAINDYGAETPSRQQPL